MIVNMGKIEKLKVEQSRDKEVQTLENENASLTLENALQDLTMQNLQDDNADMLLRIAMLESGVK